MCHNGLLSDKSRDMRDHSNLFVLLQGLRIQYMTIISVVDSGFSKKRRGTLNEVFFLNYCWSELYVTKHHILQEKGGAHVSVPPPYNPPMHMRHG